MNNIKSLFNEADRPKKEEKKKEHRAVKQYNEELAIY